MNVGTENDVVDKASPWAFYAVLCTLVSFIVTLTWSIFA